jgi:hypothetical protein
MGGILRVYSTGTTGGGGVLLGFLVAPAISSVVAVALAVTIFFAQLPGEAPGGAAEIAVSGLFVTGWMVIAFGAPAAYIGMLLVGLPAWLLLRLTRNERQENTARMNWRQKVNRRLVVVPADAPGPRTRVHYPALCLAVEHRRVDGLGGALVPEWLRAALVQPDPA